MDPYCFVKWDAECFKASFDPRPCTYMLLQEPDDFSEPKLTKGVLEEEDFLPFVQRPCEHGYRSEVRYIFTPEREALPQPAWNGKPAYHQRQPWPWTPETYETLASTCGFVRMSMFGDADRMETFKIDVDGMASLSMLVRNLQKCDIQIWVSRNENLQTINIIVHNTRPHELVYIQKAINRSFFHRLAFHPIFIFVVSMDMIHLSLLHGLKRGERSALKKITTPEEIHRSKGGGMEAKNMDIEVESGLALYRQHSTVQLMADIQMVLRALTQLKSWCKDFDNSSGNPEQHEFFRDAGAIIQARLAHIEDTLRHLEINTTKILAFTQAYKQSLEIQNATINNKLNLLISSQSRDIARESKRDSSAMKAIALLTMFFLPGTFVAAFFSMPLFDWTAPTPSTVLKSRFWIYWAVTVPATAIVLVLWRMWFKFDHWRMLSAEGGSFWSDVGTWLKRGRPGPEEDVEKGV